MSIVATVLMRELKALNAGLVLHQTKLREVTEKFQQERVSLEHGVIQNKGSVEELAIACFKNGVSLEQIKSVYPDFNGHRLMKATNE